MKRMNKWFTARYCVIYMTAACLAGSAIVAQAGPGPRGPGFPIFPTVVFGFGPRPAPPLRALPNGYRMFVYGGLTYYYFSGHYYHQGPRGYSVVTAPVGATIRFLPPGAVSVTVGAGMYYTLSGVYYQEAAGGYQIVEPPVVVEAPAEEMSGNGDYLRVTAAMLNVRSGPGVDRPIIKQVVEGDVLEIQATGSGWYYVKLPDDTSGWVMKTYTAPLNPEPKG